MSVQLNKLEQYDTNVVTATMNHYLVEIKRFSAEEQAKGPEYVRNVTRQRTLQTMRGLSHAVTRWHFKDGVRHHPPPGEAQRLYDVGYLLHDIVTLLLQKVVEMCKGDEKHIQPVLFRQITCANAKLAVIDPRRAQPGGVDYRADDFLFEAMSLYLEGEDCDFLASFFIAVAFFNEVNPIAGTFMTVAERQEKPE